MQRTFSKQGWRWASCLALLFLTFPVSAQAPNSAWVYPSASGNLLYKFDERGQRIPDFSNVGYRGGLEPLPDVARAVESNRWVFVSPVPGDDTTTIQAAINQVSAMTLNARGFRGVVFLNAGEYQLSNTITLTASGVVLKGAGDSPTVGTRLRATDPRQYTLINVDGSGSRTTVSGTTHNLMQKLVPAGARAFAVDATSGLAPGHLVRIKRPSTANWLADIDMDQLGPASGGDADDVPWTTGSKDLYFDRVITRIDGNWITVDAPLPQTFEANYGGGQVFRYTWSRVENIGVEDIYGVSDYDGTATDEDHGWTFLSIRDAQHCWVRNITAQYFGYSAVTVNAGAKWVTVADSQCLDPISVIDGGRRYSFNNNGAELTLFINNYARKGRHDFVFGALVPGPNVFVHGTADTAYSDTGPHHRWAVGGLFDQLDINGDAINVQNRGNLGTGHGWAGAYMAVWNCTADSFRVRNPPTARNWLVGSVGPTYASCCAVGADPAGTYDSSGTGGEPVHPRSLYYGQLQQRMKWPFSEFREYWLGDVDQFAATNTAGEPMNADENWRGQMGLPAGTNLVSTAFDALASNRFVAFSFNFPLAVNERVRAASLVLALRAVGNAADDALYVESNSIPQAFSALGWNVVSNGSTVQTIEINPAALADGRLNVAVGNSTAVDFAALLLQVSPEVPSITNTLVAVADAYVRGGIYATNNYGTEPTLQTKDVSASDVLRETFLRWDLTGVTGRLVQARVRLTCAGASQAGNENVAAWVSSDAWSETGVTFNNRPAAGKFFAQWLPVSGQPAEFIVTPLVAQALEGDRQLSLRISAADDFGGLGNVGYYSREEAVASRRPQLILLFSNSPPLIADLTNYNGAASFPLGPIPFTIGDAETSASNLTVAASSSNTNLVPHANISLGGTGSNRTVTITPAAGQSGSANITLTVSDGLLASSDTFVVNFGTGNSPPSISNLTDYTMSEDTLLGRPFTVSDAETPWTNLLVTATSSNTNLVPNSGLALGFAGSFRALYITPTPDAFGSSTITVTVSDGFLSAVDTFVLTITPVNDAPEFVELTNPDEGARIDAGSTLDLSATAWDVDTNLARVEFFQGQSRIFTDNTPPYRAAWTNVLPGTYALRAVAVDSNGLAVTSAPVNVTAMMPDLELTPAGAVWKFFDGAMDLGTAWRLPEFDDSAWSEGPGPLGFGDGDEATLVLSNRARITTYFRRSFVLTNPMSLDSLTLNLLRDDGAVVYLNGAEVFRSNMPTGSIVWGTFAASTALAMDESTNFYSALVSPWRLRSGTNWLAVEVHQSSANSSDLSFDLALTGPPAQRQALIAPGSAWRYLDSGIAPAATWRQTAFNDQHWSNGVARLGYGGDGETVTVSFGTNANKHITTWFRRAFTVAERSSIAALELQYQRDDGVVIYLNGTEVLRDNMPAGPIVAGTRASTAVSSTNEVRWFSAAIPLDALQAGENLLAVEVHQATPDSSDLGFDAALLATVNPANPTMLARMAGASLILNWPASASGWQLMSATSLVPPVAWISVTGTSVLSNGAVQLPVGSAASSARFFRLQSP